MDKIISGLKGKLIVSCQALEGNPLKGPVFMSTMAQAAVQGGAAAIRANGVEDVKAIKKKINIPVIGINKMPISENIPYITPNFAMAKEIYEAGADIIALDATLRERPDGIKTDELIKQIKDALGIPVMADISTYEEGMAAAEAGADIIATTLSGYTAYSPRMKTPDLELVKRLASSTETPVIAEGRYNAPEYVKAAYENGAYAVVIGKIITNPEFITRYFLENIKE